MNNFLVIIYFTLFAVIAGGAFAMMWANVQSINEEMRTPRNLNIQKHQKKVMNFYMLTSPKKD
jgi:hypothetical protein